MPKFTFKYNSPFTIELDYDIIFRYELRNKMWKKKEIKTHE